MLIEFKVSNFRSIKNLQVFSMLPEKKVKELPENLFIDTKGNSYLKSAIMYGSNGSGKSNLLKAIGELQNMVLYSDKNKIDSKIANYDPYKLSYETENSPIHFEIEFIAKDKIRYHYLVEFDEEKIIKEILIFYPKLQAAKLYSREFGKEMEFGDYLTGRKKEIEQLMYPNQLFLSKIGEQKNEQLIPPYFFFKDAIFTLLNDAFTDEMAVQHYTNKIVRNERGNFKYNINKLLLAADTGIESFEIKELDNSIHIPERTDKNWLRVSKYTLVTNHRFYKSQAEEGIVQLDISDESSGTIKLFAIGGMIVEALYDGQTIIIDELDKSLHPKLTKALINVFNNPRTNPHNAQLILATHDVSLMDSSMFRRDQVWFAEKNERGESDYYSLSSIQNVRKDVPLEKWYMSGRFGATPVINDFELNFKFE